MRKEENRKNEEQNERDEGPTNKRAKEEQNDMSLTKRTNDGVDGVNVLSVCGWRKGEREEMQDAHVLDDHFELSTVVDVKTSAFYAIFDGHAGRRAAQFAAERLPSILKTKFSTCKTVGELESGLKKSFVDGYRQVDEQFLAQARRVRPTWKDGTTATTIFLLNSTVYCANIGDSRAVVCRKKSSDTVVALQLTVDHSPLQFDERMRIQKAGGTVRDGRIMGVLEVSRSIGDGQFKAHGVTCIPDVKKFSITPEDRFILVACDGLWKTFSNQEAVEYVLEKTKETVKAEKSSEEETLIDSRYSVWERTAGELAAESVRRGCGDNVSVIIVVLNDAHA
uniref:Integrin-linked kinase-associated serine/threonine phosphatase 2C n=2 Tax=Ascaris suum TaxID=6253 RepID=F1L1J7_ASCSU